MLNSGQGWIDWCGYVLAAAALVYSFVAWFAVRVSAGSSGGHAAFAPPVTILKPLCGVDPGTYECLRTFCDQQYPVFQIVFGVSSDTDPAIVVVRRLQAEFPQRDLELVIEHRQHGSSGKVSNLINMMQIARHEFFVIADSDVRVTEDYLARVVAPLRDGGVGLVTCTYRGTSGGGLWSIMGSMFINEWFMPSVHVAALLGHQSFTSGATIAIRRQVLVSIGGFAAIADQLADDYRLGEKTRRLGLRTVQSEVVVDVLVVEASLWQLVQHELRWLRTIRALSPVGYGLLFVTFSVPVALAATGLARGAVPVLGVLGLTTFARLMLHVNRRAPGYVWQLVLLPVRDLLTLCLWSWSFVTRRVRWRQTDYHVARDGSVRAARDAPVRQLEPQGRV